MNNFRIIYRILKTLETQMDYEEPDASAISHDRLGITKERWEQLLILLAQEGYIKGVVYSQYAGDLKPQLAYPIMPVIQLKGLEYLAENSLMKKAAELAKGITEVIPH